MNRLHRRQRRQHQRRRRDDDDDDDDDVSEKMKMKTIRSRLLFHYLAMAAIYNTIRSVNGFHLPTTTIVVVSNKTTNRNNGNNRNRNRINIPTMTTRIKRNMMSSSSSSCLHVLSNPSRHHRTTDDNNKIGIVDNYLSNINTNTNINTNPLMMDLPTSTAEMMNQNKNTNNNNIKYGNRPLITTSSISIQPPPTTHEGAALISSLFRSRQRINGEILFPSPSSIIRPTSSSRLIPKLNNPKQLKLKIKRRTSATILKELFKREKKSPPLELSTVEELDRYWPEHIDDNVGPYTEPIDYNRLLKGISVKGDTQIIGSSNHTDFIHPVLKLMYERKKLQEDENVSFSSETKNTNTGTKIKANNEKIALVVEGGGMRGCVSAGMVCAIHFLGLDDTIDIVYGSSAGAVIAAYFVSKQLPYYGPEVYYDSLTTLSSSSSSSSSSTSLSSSSSTTSSTKSIAIKQKQKSRSRSSKRNNNNVIDQYENNYFMDYKRITRSMGLGLCDPRLLKDVIKRPIQGKPMMNLQYMFTNVMQDIKKIDFDTFNKRQSIQPLKVVSTSLISEQPVVLSKENGHFNSIQDLCNSLHASCLLPGIAGPVMNVLKDPPTKDNNDEQQQPLPTFVLRNNNNQNNDKSSNDTKTNENINLLYEPLGDAMFSEPIPYDIAEKDGNATHILVIRSSPDGTNLIASDTIIKWMGSLIYRRYFLKKNNLPNMYQRLQTQQKHQRIYAKNILELNEYASSSPPKESKSESNSNSKQKQKPSVMTIALSPNTTEVSHLETSREGIFTGVRQGFARAYDALVEDPLKRGNGAKMALQYFPDEILDYNPNDIKNTNDPDSSSLYKSAFEQYIESTGIKPKTWQQREDEIKNEKEKNRKQREVSSERLKRSIIRYYDQCTINDDTR